MGTLFVSVRCKLVSGSRVGQVGPVDSCGQVGDLDPSLVNSRNLSRIEQVGPVDSCGQVRNIDPVRCVDTVQSPIYNCLK